mmetsp:Transcript_47779/g.55861  ORF Transcript_47779/g.55861 Transcript_47779/m.55861 type:complete len:106 (+) Transcript_47779:178-495(+)
MGTEDKSGNNDITESSSLVCKALTSQKALYDSYPELKRECCSVVIWLCKLVPQVLQANSELVLAKVVIRRENSQLCEASRTPLVSPLILHRQIRQDHSRSLQVLK